MIDPNDNKIILIDTQSCHLKTKNKTTSAVSTEHYEAPELFNPKKHSFHFTQKTEIYATGLTLQSLVKYLLRNIPVSKLNDHIVEYLEIMIAGDPNNRPSFNDAIIFFEEILTSLKIQNEAQNSTLTYPKFDTSSPSLNM